MKDWKIGIEGKKYQFFFNDRNGPSISPGLCVGGKKGGKK